MAATPVEPLETEPAGAESIKAGAAPEARPLAEGAPATPRAPDEPGIPASDFVAFGLSEPVLRALADLGFEAPTPVQEHTIRLLMAGRDVIAQAQTGTGKTAAFGIPIVERFDPARRRPQALVLAPTRELALQVAEAIHQLGKYRNVSVLPIYGGQPIDRQLRSLREGVHVVVGTPGRVLDHLRRRTLDLGEVGIAILDEADEMLNMGFIEDVESILAALAEAREQAAQGAQAAEAPAQAAQAAKATEAPAQAAPVTSLPPPERPAPVQMALFSATIPPPIERLARRFLRDPERIVIAPEQVTVPQITQVAYEIHGVDKVDALARVLDAEIPGSAIVFCATRRGVDEVTERLVGRGYRAAALHGDMAQAERERVMRRFRDGQTEVLVATDVAARGLDISGVTHVINFDIPWDPESYVHRIGRTGRAGRAGDAITLVTPRDYRLLQTIERLLKQRITRKRLPSLADVATRQREAAKEALVSSLMAGELDGYLTLVAELGDQFDPIEVAGAALRLWDQARSATGEAASLVGALRAAEAEAEREARRAEEMRRAVEEFQADGQAPETGMARLLLSVGRDDNLRPQDVVGAIANETGLPGRDIGAIDIYDRFAFVEVPRDQAERIVEALSHTTIHGQPIGVQIAHPGVAGPRVPREARAPRRLKATGRAAPERRGDRFGARGERAARGQPITRGERSGRPARLTAQGREGRQRGQGPERLERPAGRERPAAPGRPATREPIGERQASPARGRTAGRLARRTRDEARPRVRRAIDRNAGPRTTRRDRDTGSKRPTKLRRPLQARLRRTTGD